jgi:ubiquinone/menaquinone biosynthesis C-methylase UbiE
MDSEDIQRFHRWSRTYERSIGQFFFFDLVHKAVLGLATGDGAPGAPKRILDVGCGTGRLLRKAALQWPSAELVGVDPAEGMIENARRLTSSATFHVGKGEALPVPDASVDLAFSTVSFHHWEDQAKGVREIARVLRPGGRFCLADAHIPSILARIIPHTRIHTRKELLALFRAAGLSVTVQKGIVGGAVLATIGRK